MGLKLYYGGYGEYKVFAVAETEKEAIDVIGRKIQAPYLPVEADCISEVDGYEIFAGLPHEAEKPEEVVEAVDEKPVEAEKSVTRRHCKQCDFTCDNQGDLMRHYREVHPKKGE